MISKKNKVEEISTPIKEVPILKKKNDGSFYIKKKEAEVIGKRMIRKRIIDKENDRKINYLIFNMSINTKKDMKSYGLIEDIEIGKLSSSNALVPLNKIKGCWIVKNHYFPAYPTKIVSTLPKTAKKVRDVGIINFHRAFITKTILKEAFVYENKLYIPRSKFTALKMTDLRDKKNIIYEDKERLARILKNSPFRKIVKTFSQSKSDGLDIENLKWNGQIDRFFDKNDEEYDLTCANAYMQQGGKIIHVKWTSPEGYEIINKSNNPRTKSDGKRIMKKNLSQSKSDGKRTMKKNLSQRNDGIDKIDWDTFDEFDNVIKYLDVKLLEVFLNEELKTLNSVAIYKKLEEILNRVGGSHKTFFNKKDRKYYLHIGDVYSNTIVYNVVTNKFTILPLSDKIPKEKNKGSNISEKKKFFYMPNHPIIWDMFRNFDYVIQSIDAKLLEAFLNEELKTLDSIAIFEKLEEILNTTGDIKHNYKTHFDERLAVYYIDLDDVDANTIIYDITTNKFIISSFADFSEEKNKNLTNYLNKLFIYASMLGEFYVNNKLKDIKMDLLTKEEKIEYLRVQIKGLETSIRNFIKDIKLNYEYNPNKYQYLNRYILTYQKKLLKLISLNDNIQKLIYGTHMNSYDYHYRLRYELETLFSEFRKYVKENIIDLPSENIVVSGKSIEIDQLKWITKSDRPYGFFLIFTDIHGKIHKVGDRMVNAINGSPLIAHAQ